MSPIGCLYPSRQRSVKVDNYNKKQLENLETWFDLFFRMKYYQKIKIYLDTELENNCIYEGLLEDLTYTIIQEISELRVELIEQHSDCIALIGGESKC